MEKPEVEIVGVVARLLSKEVDTVEDEVERVFAPDAVFVDPLICWRGRGSLKEVRRWLRGGDAPACLPACRPGTHHFPPR
jgi:hypothetical protein